MTDDSVLIPELTVVPTTGGYLSRCVLENRAGVEPTLRGRIVVVHVETPQSAIQTEQVQASLEPLLADCDAEMIILQANGRSVGETVMDYAVEVEATFVMIGSLSDEKRHGITHHSFYQHIRCRLIDIHCYPRITILA